MKMEYRAEILRGWPADGARERLELVKQGTVVSNGDIVEMQVDGTVALSSSTASRKVGVVIRGNFASNADGTSVSANANGRFMTPQPAKVITAATWASGVGTVTVAGHGYAVGNAITIASTTVSAGVLDGTYIITAIAANTFSFVKAATFTYTSGGTATQGTATNNSGKALVLWGNYIIRADASATGCVASDSYAPGDKVTAVSGKFAKAAATAIDVASLATITATATAAIAEQASVLGHVVRVQGATASETAHVTIVVY